MEDRSQDRWVVFVAPYRPSTPDCNTHRTLARASIAPASPTAIPGAAKRTACSGVVITQACRMTTKLSPHHPREKPSVSFPGSAILFCAVWRMPTRVKLCCSSFVPISGGGDGVADGQATQYCCFLKIDIAATGDFCCFWFSDPVFRQNERSARHTFCCSCNHSASSSSVSCMKICMPMLFFTSVSHLRLQQQSS